MVQDTKEDEINEIGKLLTKKWGYEKYEGQVMPSTSDILVHHFISKDEKCIIQLAFSEADKETLESIRQDEENDETW